MSRPTVRVLALLELLQARGSTSGAELAQALEVGRRTLRRYIATLEELGIPIMTSQGRFGGYQLVPGFKLPPLMFTDDEAVALAMGLLAARSLGLGRAMPAVASAKAKLGRVMPERLRARLNAVDDSVALDLTRPSAPIDESVLGLLTTAAQERRRIHLQYRTPRGEDTQRDFDPYGLVYRQGRWYAVGMCHLRKGLRSFRLDRVGAAAAVETRFDRPTSFDALAYLKDSIATMPRAHRIEVVLATDLATAQREMVSGFGVLEWIGDGVLLRSQADDLAWFALQLARLPFDFQVRSPAALKAAVGSIGRRLMRLAGVRSIDRPSRRNVHADHG
ncbi:MAG TPA: YafY family protein [Burkholderiaceae bacterium]|nr:YafY family protein [Burkholderiaceae bacterium]